MKEKIYIKEWLALKPYENHTAVDNYYLKLSNTVKDAINSSGQSSVLQTYLGKSGVNDLACFLTSYLEDLVSKTNIWNAFVKTHQRLYKKPLPFFFPDGDYYEEEINHQDIRFLVWYFLNTAQEGKLIAPSNDFIVDVADEVMDVFEEAWENAPENEYLKSFYQIDENETDFYAARQIIDTVLFKSYLFYPDTGLKLEGQEMKLMQERKNEENIGMFLNENRDGALHSSRTRLLAVHGKEWVAEILGKKHPLSSYFSTISQKIKGFFLYKGQNDHDVLLEHIASGKEFRLVKKSFDHSASLKEIDTILYVGIALWRDEWWFSGVSFQQPYNADMILDEKNSMASRMEVSFLDHQKKEITDLLDRQFSEFKNFNNGSQIAFLSSESIEKFQKGYIDFYNDSLRLSKKELREAGQRAKKEGLFDTDHEFPDLSEDSETGLVFFNPKSGVEIAMAVNSAFPVTANPYYEEESSDMHIMRLLMDESISVELAMYCIDNCKTELEFFTEGIGSMCLEDIDFLLRFWKKNNYHTTPSVTFTG